MPHKQVHGEASTYNHGCRCTDCKAANAAAMRAYYERHPEAKARKRAADRDRYDKNNPGAKKRRLARQQAAIQRAIDQQQRAQEGYYGYKDKAAAAKAAWTAYQITGNQKLVAKELGCHFSTVSRLIKYHEQQTKGG